MKFSRIFFLSVLIYLFYIALVLTNGHLPDFFKHINSGSMLYANMWEHFKQGNFFIDEIHAAGEYFVLNNGKLTVYYGFFPAFLRGFFDIFLTDLYKYNFNNLSILLALVVAIFFTYRTFIKLSLFSGKSRIFSVMFLIALFLGSTVSYVTAWGWIYNEPIIWGFAWTVGYISLFFLWVFAPEKEINLKNGSFMGLCVSMAVLSRAVDAIIPVISFAFIVIKALYDFYFKKDKTRLKALSAGILICFVSAGFTLVINMSKWGSPFKFQQFEKNIHVINSPQRLKGLQEEGMWNLKRIRTSFLYYFIPSSPNFRPEFPFIDVDRELTIIKKRPYYDLIMSSRVPVTLSSFFLCFLAFFGAFKYFGLDRQKKFLLFPLLSAGVIQYLALLVYAGIALRYSAGFVFLLVSLCLIFLVAESREMVFFKRPKFLYSSLIVLVISIYVNFFTMLGYKHYIRQISPVTRNFIGKVINYRPDKNHIILIKSNDQHIKFPYKSLSGK